MTDPNFFIETENLYLSYFLPTLDAHCDFIVKMYNTPEFIAAEGKTGIDTTEKSRKYIESRIIPVHKRLGHGNYLVSLKPTPTTPYSPESLTPIGLASLMRGDESKDQHWFTVPDIGWVIIPEYTKRGFATEAARGLMRFAREELGIREMFAFVGSWNEASKRVAAKLGFKGGEVRRLDIFGGRKAGVWWLEGMGGVEEYQGRSEE